MSDPKPYVNDPPPEVPAWELQDRADDGKWVEHTDVLGHRVVWDD